MDADYLFDIDPADAALNKGIDVEDTLRRIAQAWGAIAMKCKCERGAACDICEITYLIHEAFDLQEQD